MSQVTIERLHTMVSKHEGKNATVAVFSNLGETDEDRYKTLGYINMYLREYRDQLDREGYLHLLRLVYSGAVFHKLDSYVCSSLDRAEEILTNSSLAKDISLSELALVTAEVVICRGVKIQRRLRE